MAWHILLLYRVYPRVCGGTSGTGPHRRWTQGLSPRVRGNRGPDDGSHQENGSIPACAGEPDGSDRSQPVRTVYPRVCGGTAGIVGMVVVAGGLSPRVRGNLLFGGGIDPAARSIPACAGEPLAGQMVMWPVRVYPRVCGGTSFDALVR